MTPYLSCCIELGKAIQNIYYTPTPATFQLVATVELENLPFALDVAAETYGTLQIKLHGLDEIVNNTIKAIKKLNNNIEIEVL